MQSKFNHRETDLMQKKTKKSMKTRITAVVERATGNFHVAGKQ